jgi:hypothetical protein
MKNWLIWRAAAWCALCLAFTRDGSARADSSHATSEEAPRPNNTWGPSLRLGSLVGVVQSREKAATGLGLVAAGGHRFGRLAIESELGWLRLEERGPSSLELGSSTRLGVMFRYDVVRASPMEIGPGTIVALFLEGGASQTWTHWRAAAANELPRFVPEDTRRVEGQGGLGISVDHQVTTPHAYPYRVAWQLGWRFSAAPPVEEAYACRGSCRVAAPTMSRTSSVEGSVLFESSLQFTW